MAGGGGLLGDLLEAGIRGAAISSAEERLAVQAAPWTTVKCFQVKLIITV